MAERNQKDWRELCAAVVNEPDSNKLSSLVQKLVEALDAGRQNTRPRMARTSQGVDADTSRVRHSPVTKTSFPSGKTLTQTSPS
jgi:hypothetical protein